MLETSSLSTAQQEQFQCRTALTERFVKHDTVGARKNGVEIILGLLLASLFFSCFRQIIIDHVLGICTLNFISRTTSNKTPTVSRCRMLILNISIQTVFLPPPHPLGRYNKDIRELKHRRF